MLHSHRHNNGAIGRSLSNTYKKQPSQKARPSTYRRSSSFDEKAYSRYKRCVGWKKRVDGYNDEIDSLDRRIKSNKRSIDRISDQRSSAKNWMSIQEAAGDINGHNRNVRKFNSLGRKGRRIQSENSDLVLSVERVVEFSQRTAIWWIVETLKFAAIIQSFVTGKGSAILFHVVW